MLGLFAINFLTTDDLLKLDRKLQSKTHVLKGPTRAIIKFHWKPITEGNDDLISQANSTTYSK